MFRGAAKVAVEALGEAGRDGVADGVGSGDVDGVADRLGRLAGTRGEGRGERGGVGEDAGAVGPGVLTSGTLGLTSWAALSRDGV
ncbi:hypothetical protein ACFYZB_19680 [Streptomyces sp. NPDC001852]|uniref:hypothetical protein n=1 Tax=Streptomyces sp. NPDC001852 TaxID=3364619 RepID=UPI00368C5C64